MTQLEEHTRTALAHIRTLSETIGGRGSCTPEERRAAEYVADEMRRVGAADVRLERYRGAPSTYRPYILAFAAALAGTVLVWAAPGRATLAVATLLNALGVWGMLAETDFSTSWVRWFLPGADSQNAVGTLPPRGKVRQRVVLSAHLDTHRTPIFYSSPAWHALFGILVAAGFLSMALNAVAYGLGALFLVAWVRWIGLGMALMQIFVLSLCLHADQTPFSPGANDDASGVGVVLSLAGRLTQEPLAHTEVWLALTGCEEASSYGMVSFLNAHASALGPEAVYIILDQVAVGRLSYVTADGLIIKRKTHPRALALARRAAAALPGLEVGEHVGIAYTDAAVATKRGLVSLSLDSLPVAGEESASHWHQMSDTIDKVDPQTLADAHSFTWQVLQEIDQASEGGEGP
jgi:acetylornithine deacetylase/succinyl-diaminopimelate desuccinylase-like protein